MFYHITQIHPEFNLYQNHNLPRFQVVSLLRARTQTKGPEKNGKMGGSGRICLYVACYDFVLGFNVSSSPLMFFQVGFWG